MRGKRKREEVRIDGRGGADGKVPSLQVSPVCHSERSEESVSPGGGRAGRANCLCYRRVQAREADGKVPSLQAGADGEARTGECRPYRFPPSVILSGAKNPYSLRRGNRAGKLPVLQKSAGERGGRQSCLV